MAFLTGYTKRKSITIDYTLVASTLTNFPFLVKITNDAEIGGAAASAGTNIRFTSDDGTTLLSYGIVSFSISGGLATGIFRVKIPSLSSLADTVIYIYYDNPSASDGQDKTNVFDSDTLVYYPLDEDPAGGSNAIKEWKGNYHGTSSGGLTTGVGTVGSGVASFNNARYITIPDTPFQSMGGLYTLQANVYHTSIVNWDAILGIGAYPHNYLNYNVGTTIQNATSTGGSPGDFWNHSPSDSTNTWYQHAITWDGTTRSAYRNGALQYADTSAPSYNATPQGCYIGRSDVYSYFTGIIDEVIVSKIARSANWIAYDYTNQFNNSSTFILGPENSTTGWLGTWKYRKAIKYTSVPASGLTSFPLLIKINNDVDLGRALGSSPRLAFTRSNGVTAVNHGRISWTYDGTYASTNLRAKYNLSSTAASGDILGYMYYDSLQTDTENKAGALHSNIVGYWPLEGNGADWSSYANSGILINSPTFVTAKVDNGISFNGSTQWVNLGTAASLDITGPITLSSWVYLNDYTGDYYFIAKGYDGSSTQYGIYSEITTGKVGIGTYTGGAQRGYLYPSGIGTGVWKHLTGTFTGSAWKIYIDGTYMGQNLDSQPPVHTNENASIGAVYVLGGIIYVVNGKQDEVFIWNTYRDAEWIAYDYRNMQSNGDTITLDNQEVRIPWLAGWRKRKAIKYGSIIPTSNLSEFPKLFSITDRDIGREISSQKIAITLSDKITTVPYGALNFSSVSGLCNTTLRAKFDLLSTAVSGDVLGYLYYDYAETDTVSKSGVINSNIFGYWPMEETTGTRYDWSVNANNAAVNGTVVRAVGVNASGVEIGSTDANAYLAVTDNSTIRLGNVLTFGCNGKITNKSKGHTLMGKWHGSGGTVADYEYYLAYDDSTDKWITANGSNGTFGAVAYSTSHPSINTYYNLVSKMTGGYLCIYVNGILEGSGTYTGSLHNTGRYDLWFGQNPDVGYGPGATELAGSIDEVFIAGLLSDQWINYDYKDKFYNQHTFYLGNEERQYRNVVFTTLSNSKILRLL